jgi:hypothetical protein
VNTVMNVRAPLNVERAAELLVASQEGLSSMEFVSLVSKNIH